MRNPLQRRRARWAAPVAVAGAIAIGSWATTVSAGASTPNLPSLSAAQLLAKASHPDVKGFSGTVALTANLGLPDISAVTGNGGQSVHSATGFDPTTLLTGTHDIKVWDDGATKQRLALQPSLSETDLVRNGDQAWLYDSSTQTVTHYVGAPHTDGAGHHASDEATGGVPTTPEDAAQHFLDHVDPSTAVTVTTPAYVAGRSVYQLTFAPKPGSAGAAASTIAGVSMAVDSQTGMVLSFAVDAKGSATPALRLAFTSLDLATPAASNFAAPTGTTTKTETVGGADHAGAHHAAGTHHSGARPSVTGGPWAEVLSSQIHLNPRASHELDKVSTADGSARLIHTSVVNALVEPDGHLYVGFVTPAVLEAAAG